MNDFRSWLINHKKLTNYSINRYVRALEKINNSIEDFGIEKTDLFNKPNASIINRILNHKEFQRMNAKHNRMYSAPLNHYKEYLNHEDFHRELTLTNYHYHSEAYNQSMKKV